MGGPAWRRHPAHGLMPSGALARAVCRRWAGWARTGWHYQLQPLYWRDVAVRPRYATATPPRYAPARRRSAMHAPPRLSPCH